MKRLSICALSLLLLVSLGGCMNNDKESEKKTEDKVEDTKKKAEGTIDDVLNYMKTSGYEYTDDQTLSEFNFAAKEGKSFMYNNQMLYLYRVDPSDTQVNGLLEQAKKDNKITANQNGQTNEYGARVNGNYLLVYDKNADMNDFVKNFDKYTYKEETK